jgi:two-component system cell cycle response regulator
LSFGVEPKLEELHPDLDNHILIIDGSKKNWSIIANYLPLCRNHFSNTAENHELLLRQNNYDLIIINSESTNVDALEIISQIRSEIYSCQVPILLLSDQSVDRSRLATAFELGVSDMLPLPIDGNELVARCRNLLKKKLYQDKLHDHIDRTIQMVAIDPLTGLYNRRYLDKHLQTLNSTAAAIQISLLMVDIDHFKSINDRFGHMFGDLIILMISNVLLSHTRSFDTVSRYGGEEFAILLPGTSIIEAGQIADRLLNEVRSLSDRPEIPEHLKVTVSIGVASKVSRDQSVTSLLHGADKALYRAKYLGRNRVETD